jgi:NAD-dependent SIR2 family protein deacetylase
MAPQPDITFFGEKLTDDFEECLERDREQVDLLLIIGTSLKVAPVSDIISESYDVVVKVKYDDSSASAHASFRATSARSLCLAFFSQ